MSKPLSTRYQQDKKANFSFCEKKFQLDETNKTNFIFLSWVCIDNSNKK